MSKMYLLLFMLVFLKKRKNYFERTAKEITAFNFTQVITLQSLDLTIFNRWLVAWITVCFNTNIRLTPLFTMVLTGTWRILIRSRDNTSGNFEVLQLMKTISSVLKEELKSYLIYISTTPLVKNDYFASKIFYFISNLLKKDPSRKVNLGQEEVEIDKKL